MRIAVASTLLGLATLAGLFHGNVEATANPDVVTIARQAIGVPYRWGGTDLRGMDCSGLAVWAYAQIGVTVPRTSQEQAVVGQPVGRDELLPGDLVTFYPNASHAALYSGDGQVIHASTYGRPVAEVPIDAAGPFHVARRIT